jgi:hypothetical protein
MSNDQPEKPSLPKPLPFREQMKLMRDYYETRHFVNKADIRDAPPLMPEQDTPSSIEDGDVFFCGRHLVPPLDPETREAFKNIFRGTPASDEAE